MDPEIWKTLVSVGTLVIFNGAIIRLLSLLLAPVKMRELLEEKHPAPEVVDKVNGQPQAPTSSSRVAGLVGTIVLACFLWALGNVILYYLFVDASKVAVILNDMGTYFLAGSALFAPYAANQLGVAFKTGK